VEGDAVGAIIRLIDGDEEIPLRVVGVAGDLIQARAEDGPRPAVYVPYTQFGWPVAQLVVRTSLPVEVIVPELRRAVSARVSSMVPLQEIGTMADRMAATRSTPRFKAALVGAFALGLLASLALTRALSSLLYEIEPNDPRSLLFTAAVLVIVSVVACLAPARRATTVDPVTVLKA
jgi:hypothetical protein